MRSPIFLHTAVKMNADSARFLEPSQKVYELDTQYTRCQQPSIHPYKEERGAFRRVLLLSQGLGDGPRRADGAGNHCTTPASRPNTYLWDHLGADTAASLPLSSDRSLPAAAAGNSYTRAWSQ